MFFPPPPPLLNGDVLFGAAKVHKSAHVRMHERPGFPTQRWLFVLPKPINCHSLELAISNRFFFPPLEMYFLCLRMCKRNVSLSFSFFHSLYYDAAWDAIDWIRAEEPFRRLFDVSDTCPGLVFGPSRAPPMGPGGTYHSIRWYRVA